MNSLSQEIFRAYDIRGVADKQITEEVAYKIGRAFAAVLTEQKQSQLCVARDARLTGEKLEAALIRGLLEGGINVIEIGVVATPVLYFATFHLKTQNGIMVTASHNPGDYNGFKFVLQGQSLTAKEIQDLYQRIVANDFAAVTPGVLSHYDIIDEYIDYIATQIHLDKPLTIVVDAGNGVAGHIAPKLYRKLGCTVHELFCELDGNFPNHHPDPSRPENTKDLQAAVIKLKADVGLAFDGDADRLGVVTNEGEVIWPDRIMMFLAQGVLAEKPGSKILFDVKCSKHLADVIAKAGGEPMMWQTGHSLLKLKIKQEKAALGGEMSGHIFFNDRWFGFDDAMYSGARFLENLSKESSSCHEVFAALPNAFCTPEINVPIAEELKFSFVKDLVEQTRDLDADKILLDGLRLEFKDGWALMRASNTSAIIVVRFEADTEETLRKLQRQVRELMLAVKPDLAIPF